jgi:hypothetical protein
LRRIPQFSGDIVPIQSNDLPLPTFSHTFSRLISPSWYLVTLSDGISGRAPAADRLPCSTSQGPARFSSRTNFKRSRPSNFRILPHTFGTWNRVRPSTLENGNSTFMYLSRTSAKHTCGAGTSWQEIGTKSTWRSDVVKVRFRGRRQQMLRSSSTFEAVSALRHGALCGASAWQL